MRSIGTYDLHVLGTPPAFILSQDQTLQMIADHLKSGRMTGRNNLRLESNLIQVKLANDYINEDHSILEKQSILTKLLIPYTFQAS